MNKDEFEAVSKRLAQVNQVISDLDPAIRSEAFSILKQYVSSGSSSQSDDEDGEDGRDESDHDSATIAHVFSSAATPSDNVKAAGAYLYGVYGSEPFSIEELRDVVNEAGATAPDRIDATLTSAAHERKKLFRRVGQGSYRPTVHGEAYFKETFKIRKGRKKRERPKQ